jgi:hypothetical protein
VFDVTGKFLVSKIAIKVAHVERGLGHRRKVTAWSTR